VDYDAAGCYECRLAVTDKIICFYSKISFDISLLLAPLNDRCQINNRMIEENKEQVPHDI